MEAVTKVNDFMKEVVMISDKSVKVEIGTIYLGKVKDKKIVMKHINAMLSMTEKNTKLLRMFREVDKKLYDIYNQNHPFVFFKLIHDSEIKLFGLEKMYVNVEDAFKYFFRENALDKVSTINDFIYYVVLICHLHGVAYNPTNQNDEIAYYDNLKKAMNEKRGETVTFDSMYTSVWLESGTCPDDMTLYQLNRLFDRIGHMKNYTTSVLFATQGGKNDIHSWWKDNKSTKQKYVTMDEIKQNKK